MYKKSESIICKIMAIVILCSLFLLCKVDLNALDETTDKALYYVDCGNVIDGNTGNVNSEDRGYWGVGHNQLTGYMTKQSYQYASNPYKEGQLYNSITDKDFGADTNSGKEWGYTAYDGYDWWRFLKTHTPFDGFDNVRTVESSDTTSALVYKFEVDDASTLLINVGAKTSLGWGLNSSTLKINGTEVGTIDAYEMANTYSFKANGVKDTTNNKYYVTLEFAKKDRNVFVGWIEIIKTASVSYNSLKANYFVSQDGYVLFNDENGNTVKGTVLDAYKVGLASATVGSLIDVVSDVDGHLIRTVSTVAPAGTVYFANCGSTDDAAYSTTKKYGYTTNNSYISGTYDNGSGLCYNTDAASDSLRYSEINESISLSYRFDVENGSYKAVIGAYDPWNCTRKVEVGLNDGSHIILKSNANFSEHTTNGAVVNDGVLNVNLYVGTNNEGENFELRPVISYIFVVKQDMKAATTLSETTTTSQLLVNYEITEETVTMNSASLRFGASLDYTTYSNLLALDKDAKFGVEYKKATSETYVTKYCTPVRVTSLWGSEEATEEADSDYMQFAVVLTGIDYTNIATEINARVFVEFNGAKYYMNVATYSVQTIATIYSQMITDGLLDVKYTGILDHIINYVG